MKIKDIIEQLWLDCNNIPDDGTIYDPIGKLQDQAVEAVKDRVKEIELSEEEIKKMIDKNIIYTDPEVEKEDLYKLWSPEGLAKAIHTEMDKAVEGL